MLLYNTTFAVDTDVEAEVIAWLKDEFIPSGIDEDYFAGPQLLRVLGGEPGVTSLAVHFYSETVEQIEKWYADHGSRLFGRALERWQGKVMFFSTTLESLYA